MSIPYNEFNLVDVYNKTSCNAINDLTRKLERIDINSLDNNNLEQLRKILAGYTNPQFNLYYKKNNSNIKDCNREEFIQSLINYNISYNIAKIQIEITNDFRIDKFMKKEEIKKYNNNEDMARVPKTREQILDQTLSKLSNFKIEDNTKFKKELSNYYTDYYIQSEEDSCKIDLKILNHLEKTLNYTTEVDYSDDIYFIKYKEAKQKVLNYIKIKINFYEVRFKELDEEKKREDKLKDDEIKSITNCISEIHDLTCDKIKDLTCDKIINMTNILSIASKKGSRKERIYYKSKIIEFLVKNEIVNKFRIKLFEINNDCITEKITNNKFNMMKKITTYFEECNYKKYSSSLDSFKVACDAFNHFISDLYTFGGSHRKKSRSRTRSKKSKSKSKRTKSKSKRK
jgi:hypothetical protein